MRTRALLCRDAIDRAHRVNTSLADGGTGRIRDISRPEKSRACRAAPIPALSAQAERPKKVVAKTIMIVAKRSEGRRRRPGRTPMRRRCATLCFRATTAPGR
jgi:hypothetical protein